MDADSDCTRARSMADKYPLQPQARGSKGPDPCGNLFFRTTFLLLFRTTGAIFVLGFA